MIEYLIVYMHSTGFGNCVIQRESPIHGADFRPIRDFVADSVKIRPENIIIINCLRLPL